MRRKPGRIPGNAIVKARSIDDNADTVAQKILTRMDVESVRWWWDDGSAPAELREIAIYYYVDEMSHDEIAALVGVSRRTVGNRLEEFRAAVGAESAERKAQ